VSTRPLGLVLVVLGIGVVAVGLLIWSGAFEWFGKLPGDIRVEKENTRIYVPLTSMILISVVLTLAVNLVRRWF
jgi:Protein of unknown function (DUF2905)